MAQTKQTRRGTKPYIPPAPQPQEGEANLYKSTVILHSGYDSNQIESLCEFLDSVLTGKMGTNSAFTVNVYEISPATKETI